MVTRRIIVNGIDVGQISAGVDIELAIDFLFGPQWYRPLLALKTFDSAFVTQFVGGMRRFRPRFEFQPLTIRYLSFTVSVSKREMP
ncbi:TetR-like C-terminal domain-containing protein [Sulfitobacter sp.]|uniref:TetR-like C-terminal domain-containing protein n=1 Tax=Sulfitobacter sp. TaxID=1903071 RepID=UPI003EF9782E